MLPKNGNEFLNKVGEIFEHLMLSTIAIFAIKYFAVSILFCEKSPCVVIRFLIQSAHLCTLVSRGVENNGLCIFGGSLFFLLFSMNVF